MTMNSETRKCQNCEKDFVIEPEDFGFYEKIKVPPPTWCPDCRIQRRLIWRGERSLYKRDCDLCGRSIIAIYSTEKPYKVYCHECFHGDKWDGRDFGIEIDFSKPFLNQFKELQTEVPRQYAFVFQNANSEYVNGAAFNKNCYMIFVSDHNEDLMYSYSSFQCRSSSDLLSCGDCEQCYDDVMCNKCYGVVFSQDCSNSQDLAFCKNCSGCHDCVGCVNLKNKQYQIFNRQYSKEDYFKKTKELKLDTRIGRKEVEKEAHELWLKYPSKFIHGFQNKDVVGDYILNSKNSVRCYDSEQLEDCKFIIHGHKDKNCYDAYVIVDNSQYSYEVVSAITLNNTKFGYCVWNDYDVEYSDSCENSHHLFGCVGLRKQEYCILNKQYSKEEYEKLVPKIIEHMKEKPYIDKKGRTFSYGEFFPPELCPFAYNESVAQEYFPLTQESAIERGFEWKQIEKKQHEITMLGDAVPEDIASVSEDIMKEVIGCIHKGECNHGCTNALKITSAEFQLYKKLSVPIPTLCFNCRHFQRLSRRNSVELYNSRCSCQGEGSGQYKNMTEHQHGSSVCPNKFRTTYNPADKDIVYCEECYQQEIA